MPMREWLWHGRAVSDDQVSGKYHITLQHGQVSLGLSRKTLPSSQNTCRVRAGRSTWPRGVLSPALLSFTLFLTIMAGRPNAQVPSPGPEPALTPAVPGPEPVLTPAVPGPLETVPTPSERILAPVPQPFNWLEREAPSNPLLESLLSLRGPYRFQVSASLYETASDNFAHLSGSHRTETRTGVVLGTVYRLDRDQDFVSLANTVRAFYQVPTDRGEIGFANLTLNAGYQLRPLSFGLTEHFIRNDNTEQSAAISLLRPQQKFTRNTVSPQVRYDITPLTAATLAYTNTLVVNESDNQGTTITHAVISGLQHQFSPILTGSAQYAFTTSTGSGVSTTSTSSGTSGRSFHRFQANLAYDFDRTTSGILKAFTLFRQDTAPGQISRSYGASVGVRRVLFNTVSLLGSIGPTVYKRQGDGERVRANWNLSLEGPIPLFATPALTLTLTTNQEVIDTIGEVNDVGVVLRQLVAARLNYTPSAYFTAGLFVQYTRNQFLESSTTAGTSQGGTNNLWSTGLTASYALTRVISITGEYRYQHQTSSQSGSASTLSINQNFTENRVTIAVTGTFPVF
jgi:opacity protein-like surface antigen